MAKQSPTDGNSEDGVRSSLFRRVGRISLYVLAGLGSLFVLIIVLAIVFADDEGTVTPSTNALVTEIPRPTFTPIPVVVVELRDMLDKYEGNKAAAENKWKNKVVEIVGMTSEFDKNYFDIIPIDSDYFQVSGARCYPSSENLEKMNSLVKGDRVAITGIHTGVLGSLIRHIRVTDCLFNKQ